MPGKQVVRGNEAGKAPKTFPTDGLAFDRHPSALIFGETRAFSQLLLENPHLLLEVVDDGLLPAVRPPGKADQQKRQGIHRKTIPRSGGHDEHSIGSDELITSRNIKNLNGLSSFEFSDTTR